MIKQRFRKSAVGAAVVLAGLASGAALQSTAVGEASASQVRPLGAGYYKVGPFPTLSKCNAHRAASKYRFNVSRSACTAQGIGWFYTGRSGA